MNTIFDAATLDDIALLLTMVREFYVHEEISFNENAARGALQALIDNEAYGRAFLIRVDEEVIGYTILTFGYSLEFHGRDAFVDELFLRAEWRGQGIGQRTLAFLAEVCAANNIAALHLEVERKNSAAQQTYRKAGFVDHDRYLLTKWLDRT
jgi:GNAT superfamily N-acetyltransferase